VSSSRLIGPEPGRVYCSVATGGPRATVSRGGIREITELRVEAV
jgi:hypothetical protein